MWNTSMNSNGNRAHILRVLLAAATAFSVAPQLSYADQDPIASFTASETEGFAPLTVDFTSTSSDPDGDNLNLFWSFGDGATASGSEVSHTFEEGGVFTVSLTATDSGGLSDRASTIIVVSERPNRDPVARIATFPAQFFTPDEFTFDGGLSSDPDGDGLAFAWDIIFDGTAIPFDPILSGAQLLVNFSGSDLDCSFIAGPCLTPGTYTIQVIADDGFGGTSTSAATSLTVVGGSEAPVVDDTTAGNEVPQEQALTGSASVVSNGLCGIGILLPMLGLGLTVTAWRIRRRQQ